MTRPLYHVYKTLYAHWGPQHWWPADSRLEIIIGAVLTQNTTWKQVEKAIDRLKKHQAIDLRVLSQVPHETICTWIRPTGYFNKKATTLQQISKYIIEQHTASIDSLFSRATSPLRKELLSWPGVGPETADSILLYAAHREVFVVDAYTRRFMKRHGWCKGDESYDDLATLISEQLPKSVELNQEFHALIVKLGQHHCQSSRPACSACPLGTMFSPEVSL